MVLSFLVDKQIITRVDKEKVVRDSMNYLRAQFQFSPDWTGQKTAVFKSKSGAFNVLIDDDGSCLVPWEVLVDEVVEVSAFCGALITANVVKIITIASGYCIGEDGREPTPDVFTQIMTKLSEIEQRELTPEEVRAIVASYLVANDYITETDLATALADYVTETDLNTAIANFVTASDVNTIVANYIDTHKSEWEVEVTPTLQDGTKIAEIEVGGTSHNIYAPGGDMLASTYDPNETVASAGGIVDYVATKMDATNPTGTGSFSVNRQSGSTIGNYSVNLGYLGAARGNYSVNFGSNSVASGAYSLAEGNATTASGTMSHAEGRLTVAGYECQHVGGKYNDNKSETLLEIGNGTDANNRSNAFEVYSDGSLSTDNGVTKVKLENVLTKENAPRYNVLDYGLVSEVMNPQSHTDNSAALTALIAQIPNGSIIYFPAGIYSFASGITVNKDITFIGENVEMQTSGNTFDAQHNRPHDPMTILRYIGSSSNVTMFTKSGYVDVNFLNLTFDGGNSYNVTDNWTGAFTELPFYNQLETTNLVGINGLDVSIVSPGIVKNCMFWGFSGYGVKARQHQYIESCGFFWCKKGIVTVFSDNLLHNLWFCKSGTAIYMMPKENDHFASVNLSDIWADQLIDHLVEADSSVTSAQIITSNIWVDSVGKSAFYLPEATVSKAYIQGTFGRIGMDYAGIADADRTSALAQYTDFLACGRLVYSTLELNISNVTIGKGTRANQECFSRLITTYKASFNNDHNKVTCKVFPVSKLYDSNTQPQYAYFTDTDYNGTDGNVLIYGGVNFVDGFFTYTNSPIGRIKAPSKDFLVYDRVAKKLYRSTAGDNNAAWAEVEVESSGNIPATPTTDGTYTLSVVVANGTPTFSWVSQ